MNALLEKYESHIKFTGFLVVLWSIVFWATIWVERFFG